MTAIGDLASFDIIAGVGPDDHEPFVHLRASSAAGAVVEVGSLDVVLVGQLDPSAAIDLGLRILEAANAAEFDAALYKLMRRRLGDDPAAEAKAAAILNDLREERAGR